MQGQFEIRDVKMFSTVKRKSVRRRAWPYALLGLLFRHAGDLEQRESSGWYDSYDEPLFGIPAFETYTLVYRDEI
jgi:hypothetical protein